MQLTCQQAISENRSSKQNYPWNDNDPGSNLYRGNVRFLNMGCYINIDDIGSVQLILGLHFDL